MESPGNAFKFATEAEAEAFNKRLAALYNEHGGQCTDFARPVEHEGAWYVEVQDGLLSFLTADELQALADNERAGQGDLPADGAKVAEGEAMAVTVEPQAIETGRVSMPVKIPTTARNNSESKI